MFTKEDAGKMRTEQKADMALIRDEQKADMALIRAEQKADMALIRAEQKEDMALIRAEQKADMAAMNLENRIFSLTTLGISLIFPFLTFNRLNEMDKKEKEPKKSNLKKDLTSILNYLTFKD
jgi:hypothetical protein